jgi:hypothetical protein
MNVILDHAQRKSNFYIGCCDNNLTQRLIKMGFKAFHNPCCFDPTIQFPGEVKNEFNVDIAFAGTVLSPERIDQLYQGNNYREIEILQAMLQSREKGLFFDYSAFLEKVVPLPSKDTGELAFVNLMTQKARLRVRHNTPFHIDRSDEHWVMIYYVNNSEGKTNLDNSIKINPKKGKLIIFDGNINHCSYLPSKTDRCVINFNFLK